MCCEAAPSSHGLSKPTTAAALSKAAEMTETNTETTENDTEMVKTRRETPPGPPRCSPQPLPALLQQHHVPPAQLGEVVGHRGAHHAAPAHHHPRLARQRGRRRRLGGR